MGKLAHAIVGACCFMPTLMIERRLRESENGSPSGYSSRFRSTLSSPSMEAAENAVEFGLPKERWLARMEEQTFRSCDNNTLQCPPLNAWQKQGSVRKGFWRSKSQVAVSFDPKSQLQAARRGKTFHPKATATAQIWVHHSGIKMSQIQWFRVSPPSTNPNFRNLRAANPASSFQNGG